jgi:hypothetical protein
VPQGSVLVIVGYLGELKLRKALLVGLVLSGAVAVTLLAAGGSSAGTPDSVPVVQNGVVNPDLPPANVGFAD